MRQIETDLRMMQIEVDFEHEADTLGHSIHIQTQQTQKVSRVNVVIGVNEEIWVIWINVIIEVIVIIRVNVMIDVIQINELKKQAYQKKQAQLGTVQKKQEHSKSRHKQAHFSKSRHIRKVGTNRHSLEKVGTQ